jgi:hypothetical protein
MRSVPHPQTIISGISAKMVLSRVAPLNNSAITGDSTISASAGVIDFFGDITASFCISVIPYILCRLKYFSILNNIV